jgi:hypothetical protein
MSRLSYRLSKAVAAGRADKGRPVSREQVLSRLLTKRAMAHQAGLSSLEASLRMQITWSLPVRDGECDTSSTAEAALTGAAEPG